MKLAISFLITNGTHLILEDDLPPSISIENSLNEAKEQFLKQEFALTGEWCKSVKLLGFIEKNETLYLFMGVFVPENFSLSSKYNWTPITSLTKVINNRDLYFLILSFLDSL